MHLTDLTARYALESEVGRGSIGVVYRAKDQALGRPCAVKILRPELLDHARHRPRFLREAFICARLGHPNIVPVFDVGTIDLGAMANTPCLVMGLLAGRSLRTIIRSGRMSTGRMLGWFSQVCHGVAFAHERGVIHRDIKPAHIFVGDFGQVVLTDWGLAKATRMPKDLQPPPEARKNVTRVGDVVGTPAYMSPEQARGQVDEMDHRADIYALGAILYEVLTGTRPYEASRSLDVLRALRRGPPETPRERSPHKEISAALEAVCLQAMARDPEDRFDSALDLAANIDAHLHAPLSIPGAMPEDRPTVPEPESSQTVTEEAVHRLTEGRAEVSAFERQVERAQDLESEAARLLASLPYDAPRPNRSEVWRLESKARDAREQAAYHLAQAVEQLGQAIYHPEHGRAARESLAGIYHEAWRAAEQSDPISAGYHRHRAESFDDGALAATLAGRSALSVTTEPPGAAVDLCTLDDRGAVWTLGAQLRVGETPLLGRTVSASRMVIRLTTDDGLSVRVPVKIEPGREVRVQLSLPPAAHVPNGFLFVPGGRFLHGYDDHAPGAAKPKEVDVAPFCIARDPVSWEAYFEFLEDLLALNLDADLHLPRKGDKQMVRVANKRVYWKDDVYAPRGAPIRYVSHGDATAYADWLGQRIGARVRLPGEREWAFAAGASDGRIYPWGMDYVPGLADTRRRGTKGPAAVQAYPDDESPFGMRGVAGGVREWTATAAEMLGRFLIRGGSWRAWPNQCRIGARATGAHDLAHQTIGIRLACDVSGPEGSA